ncbi:Uncharacterized protein LHYA1_G003762 [Lachnellula hyalina]|uniref:T6SS Phospholipase effector Tle1-like catalytic domain-containing protein n=1 Tax=Lachnellula hyalina TaxID=1316788 RepID=A0A8H8R502_9HELO|nr:Uncharacterized protein LHYA1_G003762 [Lachnellula hyalina]TVY27756.1 Uncharacterized protein LHYA1_G003762 [Lachnellula hyalina]
MAATRKRLILCCDGTWMDSDSGFNKPTLIPYKPTGTLQSFEKNGSRWHPANHILPFRRRTSSSLVDTLTGGMLGKGISENIREVYSYITANYVPGDEIVLIGFSRGAFTVRSVAGMIDNIGLLTRSGMEEFYPIFKDQQNFRTLKHKDMFPDLPFSDKPSGYDAPKRYKQMLEERDLTRVYNPDGSKIRVQAVAVWDTVGSLGIPNLSILARLGLPHSTKEYKFYDTNLGTIRHAFQALALDEHRRPFSPAVWERHRTDKTDLRQVWFPGSHSNVGGSYDDQEMANITLAWMMDQLASIGVAFQDEVIEHIFHQNAEYYKNLPELEGPATKQWATKAIYDKHKPVRPWGLGKLYESETGFWRLAGSTRRTPGLIKRSDPWHGILTDIPMKNTNERIHSCVRIRLDLEGLGFDDKKLYTCPALLGNGLWRLRQVHMDVDDPIPYDSSWGPPPAGRPDGLRWIWEYSGPSDGESPSERILVEETLGPYERKLLLLNKGEDISPSVIERVGEHAVIERLLRS